MAMRVSDRIALHDYVLAKDRVLFLRQPWRERVRRFLRRISFGRVR